MRGQFYDEDYYERGKDSGKNSMSGPYTWDRLGNYFLDTARHIVQCYGPRTVCDFGCAKGYLVRALRSLGVDACGIDASDYAVSHADEAVHGFIHRGDLTRTLPRELVQGPVDIVTCFDLLEHIDEYHTRIVLENMLRLRPKYIIMNICVSPQDGFDASHVNVRPRGYWLRGFAQFLPGYSLLHDQTEDVWWFNRPKTLFVLERKHEDT